MSENPIVMQYKNLVKSIYGIYPIVNKKAEEILLDEWEALHEAQIPPLEYCKFTLTRLITVVDDSGHAYPSVQLVFNTVSLGLYLEAALENACSIPYEGNLEQDIELALDTELAFITWFLARYENDKSLTEEALEIEMLENSESELLAMWAKIRGNRESYKKLVARTLQYYELRPGYKGASQCENYYQLAELPAINQAKRNSIEPELQKLTKKLKGL